MEPFAIGLALLVVCVGVALVWRMRPRKPLALPAPQTSPSPTPGDAEFAALSEAQRCDFVFALAALESSESEELLARALDDPSEAVALAAAHALARRGGPERLERYLAARHGERAQRIAQTVDLLGSD